MKRTVFLAWVMLLVSATAFCQTDPFEKLDILIGQWNGTGSGFGNDQSTIESSFNYTMDGQYIEVINDSKFEPTQDNPEGEHHVDKGFISFDMGRKLIVYRQFNIEGYINQYVLNDALSNDTTFVFETETIENLAQGKARWTIHVASDSEIETVFDVSFTGDEYTCLGINKLKKE